MPTSRKGACGEFLIENSIQDNICIMVAPTYHVGLCRQGLVYVYGCSLCVKK